MAANKVIFGNQTLIDLTADTVTPEDLTSGKTAHGANGELITGTNTKDADTADATATAAEILDTKTAYVNGNKLTGTMPNRGGVTGSINTVAGTYTIQSGYHDGSGEVSINETEQAKIIAGNIKSGVEILGVTGTYEGDGGTGQSKTATPYTTAQTITPDTGYDYLTQVTVEPIGYTETDNAAGGKTVTIGALAPA